MGVLRSWKCILYPYLCGYIYSAILLEGANRAASLKVIETLMELGWVYLEEVGSALLVCILQFGYSAMVLVTTKFHSRFI